MARNGNVYIPPNLVKDVIPFFHLDNVDWNEDRPDGKGTSHLLQLTICQKKLHDHQSLQLQLDHRTTSLMLKPNKFDKLDSCDRPIKSHFKKSSGCKNFLQNQVMSFSSQTVPLDHG